MKEKKRRKGKGCRHSLDTGFSRLIVDYTSGDVEECARISAVVLADEKSKFRYNEIMMQKAEQIAATAGHGSVSVSWRDRGRDVHLMMRHFFSNRGYETIEMGAGCGLMKLKLI